MLTTTELIRRALAGDQYALRELIGRALDGEREASRFLFNQLIPVIHERAARALRRAAGRRDWRQEVRDLVHDVWVALWDDNGKRIREWSPEGGASLPTWIGTVAHNEIVSKLRTRKQNIWGEEATESEKLNELNESRGPDSSGEPALDLEKLLIEKDQLRLVLDRLTEKERELYRWIYVEDLSVKEICARSGLSRDAVYQRQSRLIKRIREILAELEPPDSEK